jgi:cell division ATP-binding protein FtsE
MPIIEFRKVNKVYPTGTCALRNVSFSVKEGEFVFLVGESGAGKSTIFKLLTCEERPTSGQVLIDHYNITHMKERYVPYLRRQMGLIFQDFRLIDTMTVGENVAFAMQIIGEPVKKIKQRVPIALSVVGLRNKIDEYPSELSGGEAQRVCIARAIVNRPKIIIADEPTGDLDPLNGESIMALLERTNSSNGTTVLTCSHDRVLINKMRKRVIELQQGELIRDEPCGQYFPASDPSKKWVPFVEHENTVLNGDEESAKRKAESEALISEGEAALHQLRLEDEEEAKKKKSGEKELDFGAFSSSEKDISATDDGKEERAPKRRSRRDIRSRTIPPFSEKDDAKNGKCLRETESDVNSKTVSRDLRRPVNALRDYKRLDISRRDIYSDDMLSEELSDRQGRADMKHEHVSATHDRIRDDSTQSEQDSLEQESLEMRPDNRLSEMARADDLMDILRRRSDRRRDRMSLDDRLKQLQDAYSSDALKDEGSDDDNEASSE